MKAATRLEVEILIPGGEENFIESCNPSNPYILHERLSTTQGLVYGD
jgi:hypothetical protein